MTASVPRLEFQAPSPSFCNSTGMRVLIQIRKKYCVPTVHLCKIGLESWLQTYKLAIFIVIMISNSYPRDGQQPPPSLHGYFRLRALNSLRYQGSHKKKLLCQRKCLLRKSFFNNSKNVGKKHLPVQAWGTQGCFHGIRLKKRRKLYLLAGGHNKIICIYLA